MKNLLKNITITALLAVIAYLLLDNGTGVISIKQLGTPMFIWVLGTVASYTSYSAAKEVN